MKRLSLLAPLLLLSGAASKSSTEPVVVAAVDIPAGTVVTFEMISQRSIDRSLMRASYVKPDSASDLVNQRTIAPMLAGDLVRWSFFETTQRVGKSCPVPPGDAKAQLAAARGRVLGK